MHVKKADRFTMFDYYIRSARYRNVKVVGDYAIIRVTRRSFIKWVHEKAERGRKDLRRAAIRYSRWVDRDRVVMSIMFKWLRKKYGEYGWEVEREKGSIYIRIPLKDAGVLTET